MQLTRSYIIFALTVFLAPLCFSQQGMSADSILYLLEEGDKKYSKNLFEEAADIYQLVASDLQNDQYVDKRIAVSLFKLERYEEALPLLQELRASADTMDIFIDYYLAVSYHKLGYYAKALNMYESCLLFIDENSVESGKEDIGTQIAQCKFWMEISESELDVKITRLDSAINSAYPDYGAIVRLADSSMYYTSRRKNPGGIAGIIQKADEDVYISKYHNGLWQKAIEANSEINSASNNAVIGMSPDGKSIFLYNDIHQGDIMLKKIDGKASLPEFIRGDINTEFTESSITFNRAGDLCYFVSDRTDIQNYGGKDIYSARLDSGIYWRNIQNLGPLVNSRFDEDFVFWCEEDTALYLSSNRENSLGGFDIFISKSSTDGSLARPRNIGLPINTPLDDIAFFKSGSKAWYSTTFENYKEDIFEIDFAPHSYNPDWHKLTIEGFQRIDEFRVVENIFFGVGQKELDANDPSIRKIINVLKNIRGAKICLSGYSDWTGNETLNDKLAFKRAINLASVLVDNQVDPKMLSIQSFGHSKPITDTLFSNDVLLYQALNINRSVQLTVEKQGTPYLFVKEPANMRELQNMDPSYQFAVMVYISAQPDKTYHAIDNIEEHFSIQDNLFYYHSEYYSSISDASKKLETLNKMYKNAFLFEGKINH